MSGRNVFVLVKHDADNKHVTVERGARRRMPMPTPRDPSQATSLLAAAAFLKEWNIEATPMDMERVYSKETPAQPYVVRVRCVRGVEA